MFHGSHIICVHTKLIFSRRIVGISVILVFTSGAIPETVYVHAEEVSDVTYVIDRARVKVKAIGTLTRWDIQSLHKTEPVVHVNRVAADSGDTDEPTVDLSKVSVNVCILT